MNFFLLTAKRVIASLLTHNVIGKLIGWVMRDQIPAFGLRIGTQDPAVSAHVKAKLFFGIYESAERRFVSKYLPIDVHVVEFGSSLGVLTCLIRKRLPENLKVVAVEANPNLVPILKNNLAVNGCVNNVFIEAAAVSYQPGCQALFQQSVHSTDGRLAPNSLADGSVAVPAIKLSDILRTYRLDDFSLVCDIEGAEWEIFENDLSSLEKAKVIIIELHKSAKGQNSNALLNQILASGQFVLVDQYGPTCVLSPTTQSSSREQVR